MIEINVGRIIRDGLDMERNFLEHVELRQVQDIEAFTHPALKKLLSTFYKCEGGLPYLASMLNGILTQDKVTFFLNYRVMSTLIRNDPNIEMKELSPFIFKTFLEKATRGGFLKQIGGDEGMMAHIYTLIHPDVLKYFYRTLGKEAIAEQRSYVIQYVQGIKEFQKEEPEPVILLEDVVAQDSAEELTPPPLPAPATMAPVSGPQEVERLSEVLMQETLKYKMLLERARVAENYRLNNEEDQKACQKAVLFATEAKQQEKRVNELEFQFIRLKEAVQKK